MPPAPPDIDTEPVLPFLSGRARQDVIAAALEVVAKRSIPSIAHLFGVVRRLDRRSKARPQGCPVCERRRLRAAPTIRTLLDEHAPDDQVLRALRNVHRLRDREYVVQLLEPWLWRGSLAVRLQAMSVLTRYLDLRSAVQALALPSLVAGPQVRRAAVQLLERAGATSLVLGAVRAHPGLRRALRCHHPELQDDIAAELERAAVERDARLRTAEGWCEELLRLNGAPRRR